MLERPRSSHLRWIPAPLIVLLLACGGGDDGGPSGPIDPPAPTNEDPVARFDVETTGSAAPVAASFDATGSSDPDGEVVSYAWRFGDGATATGATAEHVYDEPGSYTVELTVTDDDGATASAERTVEVSALGPDQVAGVVWFDRDGDGVRDGDEEGWPGITVFLDADADGELDGVETSVTTGAGGIYTFDGVAAGTHRVTQRLPIGWTNTAPGADAVVDAPGGPIAEGALAIIEGEPAPPDSFPFMVSVQVASEPDTHDAHICGGSLVAPGWVLTASHCLTRSDGTPHPPELLEILVGTQDFDGSGQRVPIERTVINPGYSPGGGFYKRDISLVKLAGRFEDRARVFLMDSTVFEAVVEPGDLGVLIGWGLTVETADGIPETLHTAEIEFRDREVCEEFWNSDGLDRFEQTMICVDSPRGVPTSCRGDSGGPYMFPFRGRFHQLGVVSWGFVTCAAANRPSVYASVPAMLAFIREHVPPEPSGTFVVEVGDAGARVDFGNFH